MQSGLTAGDLDHIGTAFVAHDGVQHAFDGLEVAKLVALRTAGCVADRALQVAVIADFHQREAGVLLVIGAQSAVIGTAPFHGRVVVIGHLRRLQENFPAAAVIVHIIGNEDALVSMNSAALEHEDVAVFEDNLGIGAPIAS